jgi:uncharacterized protein (TIGR02147 family)
MGPWRGRSEKKSVPAQPSIARFPRFTDYLSMAPEPVNIFAYTDFRKYLGDFYQERKSRDRKFSHRSIAEKVKAGSSGWFADVVKGRLNLTGAQMIPLAKVFRLKSNEVDYLEAMVHYGQAGSIDEKLRFLQKMLSFKEVSPDLVGADRLEFYSSWYHGALRELLFFHPFRGDYAALARKLSPPIRQSEAKESVLLLERLGFFEPNGAGGYRAKEATLKKDSSFPSVVMANFLKANMELAIDSMDRYSKEERDVSALTISLSDEAFGKVREEIRSLRKRILAMTEVDTAPSKVYQCNIQFFPLSQ